MTYLIDISGSQLGLDIILAREAGNSAVIVKAVAGYKPEHTVAEGYRSNIDRTILAGLPKGHYLVPNSRNTPEQSAEFLAANLYRYAAGDVLMLDNEPLDTYAVHWRDDECARFFTRLHDLTGAPYRQMWWYCPAALTRSTGPWPKTLALGVRVLWVSYGDNDPYREDGEEPLLGGGVEHWDIHQFTSTYRVPGYGGNLDRNFSAHSVGELFGGDDSMSMEDQMRAWAAANQKPYDAATWDQKCGSQTYRFNAWRGWAKQPTGDIHSAWSAGSASGVLNLDASKAPVGAFHFFDIGGTENGHVMQDAAGGGWRCLMAGWAVGEKLSPYALGFQSVAGYAAAKGARYRGWATNYAGGTIAGSSTAGGGYTTIEEEDMQADERAALFAIKDAIFTGGTSMKDKGRSISETLAMLNAEIIRSGSESPDDASIRSGNYPKKQDDADTNTMVRAIYARGTAAIDIDALAAKIAALIEIPAGSGVTEPQVEAIIRRVFLDAGTV